MNTEHKPCPQSRERWRAVAVGAIFGSIFATWPSASNPWQHALIVAVVILVISVLWWLDRASDGVTP